VASRCCGRSSFTNRQLQREEGHLCLPADQTPLDEAEVIDRLGDAGIATVNLAVDSVKDRKSLPKAWIRSSLF